MNTIKILKSLTAAALVAGALTGCSSSSSSSEDKTIKVAASPTPHAIILNHVKSELKKEGYDLKVTEFSDYVQPNNVVQDGDYDANYFQHTPYLDSFNKEHKTDLVSVGKIHYEPFGIYAGTKKSLKSIKKGDVVAVPNDVTNEARALLLLQDQGLLELKKDAGINATTKDITSNPYKIEFKELEAAQVSRVNKEVAYVVLNGNYALDAKYKISDALVLEKSDSTAASTYANIIVVKKGNENKKKIKALVKVLKSSSTQKWIKGRFKGAVVGYTGK